MIMGITEFLFTMASFLLTLLISVLGWTGISANRKLNDMGKTLISMDRRLCDELYGLDRRVTRIETYYSYEHGEPRFDRRRKDRSEDRSFPPGYQDFETED